MPAAVSAEWPAVALARRAASTGDHAGAQLLLLARGEQQRVVDPGAEAEHAGERRREAGHVGGGGQPTSARRSRSRGRRTRRGARCAPHAGCAARRSAARSRSRGRSPRRSGSRRWRRRRSARPTSRRRAGREGRRGVLEPLARRGVELLGGLVVADRARTRCGRPRTSRQVVDGDDVRLLGDLGERAVDLARGERAVAGAEHERGLGARLRGEALLEQVLGALGLDARDGEVVLEGAAGGDRAADQGGEDEQDGERRAAGTAARRATRWMRGGRTWRGIITRRV